MVLLLEVLAPKKRCLDPHAGFQTLGTFILWPAAIIAANEL
jgi:hypothetical protein